MPMTWIQTLLEWQRDWNRKATYDAVTGIVREHGGIGAGTGRIADGRSPWQPSILPRAQWGSPMPGVIGTSHMKGNATPRQAEGSHNRVNEADAYAALRGHVSMPVVSYLQRMLLIDARLQPV